MEEIYNYILDNIYIFCLILILVFALIIFIMYLVKTGNDKDDSKEIIDKSLKSKEELEKISDAEIEKRVMQEYKEETEELDEKLAVLKEKYKDNTSVETIIDNLKEAKDKRTSEDLRKFEEEQEEQAIISYQQLVEAVRGNETKEEKKEEIVEPEEDETHKLMEKIENLEMEIDDEPVINKDEKTSSFKPNEFISPVFGRMDSSKVRYREGLSYTDKVKKEEPVAPVVPKPVVNNYEADNEELFKTTRLDSEEFLKNLKEFRRNL